MTRKCDLERLRTGSVVGGSIAGASMLGVSTLNDSLMVRFVWMQREFEDGATAKAGAIRTTTIVNQTPGESPGVTEKVEPRMLRALPPMAGPRALSGSLPTQPRKAKKKPGRRIDRARGALRSATGD